MEITREMLKELGPAIDSALKPLAEQHGIQIRVGNGVYGGLDGSLKLLLSTTSEEGETSESRNFKIFGHRFGMDIEWLGKSFKNGSGISYTIQGLNSKRRKYNIVVVRDSDQKKLLMSSHGVQQAMKRQEKFEAFSASISLYNG